MKKLLPSQRPAPQGDDPATTALLDRARTGDRKALGELTEKHRQPLLIMVNRMLQNPDATADVVQEACYKVVKYLHSFDGRYKFSTWFYRIVRNEALNYVRQVQRKNNTNLDDVAKLLVDEKWDPSLDRRMLELQEALRAAFALIPKIYRVPLIMQHHENLTYDEIAEVMGLPLGTVKSRVYRGHEYVRTYLRSHALHLLTLFGITEKTNI